MEKIWDTMKRPSLRKTWIEEGKESHLKGLENISNNIIEENVPNLKEMPLKVQEAYRATSRLAQRRKSLCQIIIKTLNIQNKERMLKAARGKSHVIYTGRPIKITPDFWTEALNPEGHGQTDRCLENSRRPRMPSKPTISRDRKQEIPWQGQI